MSEINMSKLKVSAGISKNHSEKSDGINRTEALPKPNAGIIKNHFEKSDGKIELNRCLSRMRVHCPS